eukprot:Awhi_evm1s9820
MYNVDEKYVGSPDSSVALMMLSSASIYDINVEACEKMRVTFLQNGLYGTPHNESTCYHIDCGE